MMKIDQSSMEDVFSRNVEALKKHRPALYTQLDQVEWDDSYQLITDEAGRLNVFSHAKDLLYYDLHNPIAAIDKELAEFEITNNSMILFLGMGLGYEAMRFVQIMVEQKKACTVLIVERDPQLILAALQAVDFTVLITSRNVDLFVGQDEKGMLDKIKNFVGNHFVLIKNLQIISYSSAFKLNKEYYLNVINQFKRYANYHMINFGNDPDDSLIGVRNMLGNLEVIVQNPGMNLLFNRFVKKPAVIVATGPSLNKNKHLLKGLEDKALIVAADASLRPLLNIGVKPHLVTSLERAEATVRLLEGFAAEEVEDVYLAATPVVLPEMYDIYPGPKIMVYRNYSFFTWIPVERGMLPIRQSAGNMAFEVAAALGCDPIILIGQDLAFGRDGSSHAEDFIYGEKSIDYNRLDVLEVMGNDGQMIRTTRIWNIFLQAYEQDMLTYSGTCINATEGGAYISGTLVMPFQEAIRKYITDDIKPLENIRSTLQVFSPEPDDMEMVKRNLEDLIWGCDEVIAVCDDVIQYFSESSWFFEIDPAHLSKLNKRTASRMVTMNKNLNAFKMRIYQCPVIFGFFDTVLRGLLTAFEMQLNDVDANRSLNERIYFQNRQYFDLIERLRGIIKIAREDFLRAQEKLENH